MATAQLGSAKISKSTVQPCDLMTWHSAGCKKMKASINPNSKLQFAFIVISSAGKNSRPR
jgi:hypothetical protein